MRVTQISINHTTKYTTFSADFIFSHPYGGKKEKLLAWGKWLIRACTNPIQAVRYGFTVRRRIWYTVPSQFATQTNFHDAFFVVALPLAIAMNEDLIFEGRISSDLAARSDQVQKYYHEIARRKILVKTGYSAPKQQTTKRTGQFFTLGVDSFYTLLSCLKKNNSSNYHLIYVDGYDVPFYQKRFLKKIHHQISNVATQTEARAIYIETNLREVSDAVIGWGRFHVSALVAAGIFTGFNQLYISGESFEFPDWGLRYGVDKLYSTKNQQVKLVAHNVLRKKKIKQLVNSQLSELFLRFVRVCWENVRLSSLPYNCSVCQKCLKTHLTLLTLGIKNPPTFSSLNIRAIQKIQLVEHVYEEWQDLYNLLRKKQDSDPLLLSAIHKVLEKPLRR